MSAHHDQSLIPNTRLIEDPIDDLMRMLTEHNALQRELLELSVRTQHLLLDEMSMLPEIRAQQMKP